MNWLEVIVFLAILLSGRRKSTRRRRRPLQIKNAPMPARKKQKKRKTPKGALRLELVPEPCWGQNAHHWLRRADWDAVRRKIYIIADYICEICGEQGSQWPVECHEVWHYDDKRHVQTLVDLKAVCPLCHMTIHFGNALREGRREEAIRHLCKVNGWSKDEAEQHVADSFQKYWQRNRYSWRTDMKYIDKYLGAK